MFEIENKTNWTRGNNNETNQAGRDIQNQTNYFKATAENYIQLYYKIVLGALLLTLVLLVIDIIFHVVCIINTNDIKNTLENMTYKLDYNLLK